MIFAVLMLIGFSTSAQQALGEVQGYLFDKDTQEELPLVHVFIQDFDKRYQVLTDEGGMFRISAIPAGTYTLQIRYLGDTARIYPVEVAMNSILQLGKVELETQAVKLGGLVITPTINLIKGDLPVPQISRNELQRSVGKFDPAAVITSLTSEVRQTEDGSLVFRGARKGDMLYIVDGIKANDVVRVPSAAIGNMMVYTGALPAKYGDTLGGVVVVETTSYFDLYRAWMAGK